MTQHNYSYPSFDRDVKDIHQKKYGIFINVSGNSGQNL